MDEQVHLISLVLKRLVQVQKIQQKVLEELEIDSNQNVKDALLTSKKILETINLEEEKVEETEPEKEEENDSNQC